MEMPKPGPGHQILNRLAGQWEGDESMYPSQWDPKGGVARGRMSSRVALGGFALLSDYEQSRDGRVTYQGHSVVTFDSKSGSYLMHWFDCMGGAAEIFTGRFDGNVLTVAHGGPGMHARMAYDVTDGDVMKTRMEMSSDGTEWRALFDGVYRRS
jgi:uncharacterized protein YodC (DUF2158 family)